MSLPRPTRRPLGRALLALASATFVAGLAPVRGLGGQEATAARHAPPTPLVIRRDGVAPSASGDPSLAHGFGAVADGIPLDGIGQLFVPVPGNARSAFACTAQRFGARALLTAAHCVTDAGTGAFLSTSRETTAWFRGPGDAPGRTAWHSFAPSRISVRPEWQGFTSSFLRYDIAVLHFDELLPEWMTSYELFDGDPLGAHATFAGYGRHGGGVGAVGTDGRRRWATNRIEVSPQDAGSKLDRMLLADFDDGSARWDSFCLVWGVCDRGTASEGAIGGGDSGGPLFVGGRIAGVASFGSAFCANAGCTATYSADPSRADAFGTFHGWTPVAYNSAWIAGTVVPEPGTWLLLGTGLLAVGAVARRRAAERDGGRAADPTPQPAPRRPRA